MLCSPEALCPAPSLRVRSARLRPRTRCPAPAAAASALAQSEPSASVGRRGLLQLATCACCMRLLPAAAAEWSYGDAVPSGVVGWPAASKTCAAGSAQSPVDLRVADVVAQETRALTFNYAPRAVTVSNPHGGGAQVGFAPTNAPTVMLGERKLELLQFHFHTPSEHALDGNRRARAAAHAAPPLTPPFRLAMEAHLVHRDVETGTLAVLGVLMRADGSASPNACLTAALRYGPSDSATSVPALVNPAALLPSARTFLEYHGSLTTPPCSEEVTWVVFETPIAVQPSQVVAYQTFIGQHEHSLSLNARPLQPLNGRPVKRVSGVTRRL